MLAELASPATADRPGLALVLYDMQYLEAEYETARANDRAHRFGAPW